MYSSLINNVKVGASKVILHNHTFISGVDKRGEKKTSKENSAPVRLDAVMHLCQCTEKMLHFKHKETSSNQSLNQ
jgi:hypothetical protein